MLRLVALCLSLSACAPLGPDEGAVQTTPAPAEPLPDSLSLPDGLGTPEGVGFYEPSRHFYVGSIAHGTVSSVAPSGEVTTVVVPEEEGWSTLGVTVEGDDVLVCAVQHASTAEARSQLWVHHVPTGLTERIDLQGQPADCNDLAWVDGSVYLTDREAPVVHRVDLDAGTSEVWLTHDELQPQLIGNNGLRYDPDHDVFLLGQYAPARLLRIPLSQPDDVQPVELDDALAGFLPDGADGITWHGTRLAVATHGSVALLDSDDGWLSARVEHRPTEVSIEAVVQAEGRLYGLHGAVAAYVLGSDAELPYQLIAID
jgi:hypothetical protein